MFTNNKTYSKQIYLRDYLNTYLYDKSGKKLYNHEHAIFISPFQLNKIINSPHLYFDGTFVYPSDFKQMIIILYYDTAINKKSPAAYILLINKNETSYLLTFKALKKIITLEGESDLSMIFYTTDYELALSNALETIFPNIRRFGCYYHYSYNIRENIKIKINIGNIKDENQYNNTINLINDFQTEILSILFTYQNNNNIIRDLFSKYNDTIFNKFKHYFKSQWENLFKKGILNYAFATKIQRSNSFIENYNRRIKSELCKLYFS